MQGLLEGCLGDVQLVTCRARGFLDRLMRLNMVKWAGCLASC